MPGAALGILRNGSVQTAYYGVVDVTTRESVSPATRFAIGSLTKSMVATAIARLVEAGALSLDDSVAAYVPELRASEWGERATVRDLLANRAPIPLRREFEFSGIEGADDEILSPFASRLAAEPPTAVPWSYSNARWSLLGRALETLTGRVWEDALRTTLLVPAGWRRQRSRHARARSRARRATSRWTPASRPLSRGRREPSAPRGRRCSRRRKTCCGSPRCTWTTSPLPPCVESMRKSTYTRGSMRGASDGRGLRI